MNKPITDQAMREWTARAWEEAQAEGASMNRDDIDKLWQQAMHESIAKGEAYTRYRFAELVAAAEQDRILRIVYEQLTPYGKPGECAWIGVKHNVRKK